LGFLLHHSITESAEQAPEHEAFRCDGEALSYGELEQRSNRVARWLLERGLERSDRVGLYLNKSLELPVALYGILKAGGAYVPIDPAAPRSRVEFVLNDCGVRHLVTHDSKVRNVADWAADEVADRAILGCGDPSVGVSGRFTSWADLETLDASDPAVQATELDLAYIMYTSGSTGTPKGLMHTHASGLAYARMSGAVYEVCPEDRLGNHSPLHFDMSTFEYLTGPLFGSTTVILPEEATMFPVELARIIAEERLTHWYSVPLALIQLVHVEGIEAYDHSSLRWVLFGGEPFPPKVLWRLMELWPEAQFSNSYGPAEVNQCTYFHVPRARAGSTEPIPIGRVWPGAEGLIVDTEDREVAGGENGELLIRAPTMMRGYWARPDLNEEAFFRRERSSGFEEVYYRTGDLVREGADGELEFLGRRDRQIKIRGYRVELDEVENVITTLDGVREGAAIALTDADGQKEIHAAVLPVDNHKLDPDTLRRSAAEKLPGYAVPKQVWIRQAFPRTGSGKIDRRGLAEELDADVSAPD